MDINEQIDFMTHPEDWPGSRLCCLKRIIKEGMYSDEFEFGLLENNSGSTVFLSDGTNFKEMFAGKKIKYSSFQDLVNDGWRVD